MKRHVPNESINKPQVEKLDVIKEAPYEVAITARLLLDEICYKANKKRLEEAINEALDKGDHTKFKALSEEYRAYHTK